MSNLSSPTGSSTDFYKLMGFIKETPPPSKAGNSPSTSTSSESNKLVGVVKEKPHLPEGWIVKQSNSYPDRVYYFNVLTGTTTWKMPELSSSDDTSISTAEISNPSRQPTRKESKSASVVSLNACSNKPLAKTRQLRIKIPSDQGIRTENRIPSVRMRIEKYRTDQRQSLYKLGQKGSEISQGTKDGKVNPQQFKDSRSEHVNKRRHLSNETVANPWPSPPWGIPIGTGRLPGTYTSTSTPESLNQSLIPSQGGPSDLSSISSGSKMETAIYPHSSKGKKKKKRTKLQLSVDNQPPTQSSANLLNKLPEQVLTQSQNCLRITGKKPSVSSLSSSDKESLNNTKVQQLSVPDLPRELKRDRKFVNKSHQGVEYWLDPSPPIPTPDSQATSSLQSLPQKKRKKKSQKEPTTTPPLTPNQEDDSLSLMEIDFPNQQDEMINTETKANCKAKPSVHVVIDTNIWMGDMHFARTLFDKSISGLGNVVFVVPWVVMQELDRLKNETSGRTGSKAIRFLHKCFTSGHPRVIGEPMRKVTEEAEFEITCNDDWILQCCLKYQKKVGHDLVVLLSNDKHLCSKAIISHIKAFSAETLLPALESLATVLQQRHPFLTQSPPLDQTHDGNLLSARETQSPLYQGHEGNLLLAGETQSPLLAQSNGGSFLLEHNSPRVQSPVESPISDEAEKELCNKLACDLKEVLQSGLSEVLQTEMKSAYQDLWLEIVLKKPPWTFNDVMQCFDKHWMAVFGMFLNREDKRRFQQLYEMTENHHMGLQKIKQLINSSIFFCRRLQQRCSYNNKVLQSIIRLGELKKQSQLPLETKDTVNEEVVFEVFQTVWIKIRQLSALIFEGLGVPHDLETDRTVGVPTPEECLNCLQLLCQMLDQITKSLQRILQIPDSCVLMQSTPFKHLCTVLHSFLHEFISDKDKFSGLTNSSLQRFVLVSKNKQVLQNGIVQFTETLTKLVECKSAFS
ncbi:transcriptional protein SWT1-like isoform X2 [Asterias rubens]|uniref:transcriptional protein SWT1-like isoform X2 n=1 Tax=Asterias rubens TaxID=7604 RepID=UPI0014550F7E|nr:transcriptional protein SWT1-like isoform X2 [Asterias rubens]